MFSVGEKYESECAHNLAFFKKQRMAGWYDPPQLLRTGPEVIVSTLFARHSDSHRLDAIASIDAILNFDKQNMLDDNGDLWF